MALAGVKVLDLTRFQNGPFATCLLADVGAMVVKVEQPGSGDTGRNFISNADGFNAYNVSLNRGKRSIELDLKSPEARPVMERLVKWADVLVENFKVGVLDRLGWSYDVCRAINPGIIYCTNSGFGPVGPWAERGSFDVICQGFSGAAVAMGGGPSHRPVLMEWGAADQIGALNFAFHIAAALVARGKTGIGQKVECSQLGAMVQFQAIANTAAWYNGAQRDNGRPPQQDNVLLSSYPCGDGKWLVCAPCMEERHWLKFCEALDLEDMLNDKRTATGPARFKNFEYFRQRIEARLADHPRDHWVEVLINVDVPVGPVFDYAEVRTNPQICANEYVVDVDSEWGRHATCGVTARYSGTPPPAVGTAPDLGEHTEQVLRDICGMSTADIASLGAAHATTPDPASGYTPPLWMQKHRWKPGGVARMRSRL